MTSFFNKIFAVDLKVCLGFNKEDSVLNVTECQADIDTIVAVSSSWGLNMNPSKGIVTRFSPKKYPLSHFGLFPYSFNGTNLNFVESHSDLGVTID